MQVSTFLNNGYNEILVVVNNQFLIFSENGSFMNMIKFNDFGIELIQSESLYSHKIRKNLNLIDVSPNHSFFLFHDQVGKYLYVYQLVDVTEVDCTGTPKRTKHFNFHFRIDDDTITNTKFDSNNKASDENSL